METLSAAYGAGYTRLKLTFKYDSQGRRAEKLIYSYSSDWVLQSGRRYLYNGWDLIAEFATTASTIGSLQRSYTWGLDVVGSLDSSGGVGALLQIRDHSASAAYLPAYDGNGNVAALLNASNGNVAAAYEYSPFGELLRKEGTYAGSNPFRFSTKYTDDETSLSYYGTRYYSASLGRFINRDPIAETGGLNLYGFCGNDGINRWDVLGMWPPLTGYTVSSDGVTVMPPYLVDGTEYDEQGNPVSPGYTPDPDYDGDYNHMVDRWMGGIDESGSTTSREARTAVATTTDPKTRAEEEAALAEKRAAAQRLMKQSQSTAPNSLVVNAGRHETGVRTTTGDTKADEKVSGERRRGNQDDQLTPPLPGVPAGSPVPDPLEGLFPDNGGFGQEPSVRGLPPFGSPPKDLIPYGGARPPIGGRGGRGQYPWPTWPGNGGAPAVPQPPNNAARNIGIGLGVGAVVLILIDGPLPFGDAAAVGMLGGAAATR